MDPFDVVAVEVADEDGVVARVVLREDPRRVEDLGARVEGGLVHGVDLVGAEGVEGDVQLTSLRASRRSDPEAREALATGDADGEGVTDRMPDDLGEPDRPEDAEIEGDRGVEIGRASCRERV